MLGPKLTDILTDEEKDKISDFAFDMSRELLEVYRKNYYIPGMTKMEYMMGAHNFVNEVMEDFRKHGNFGILKGDK
jgi:hypothetical protein